MHPPNNTSELLQEYELRKYGYLKLIDDEIRLFRGYISGDGALHGQLHIFGMSSPDLPAYCTVSYTWGAPIYSQYIHDQDCLLPVLDSLEPLLRLILPKNTSCQT